MEANGNQIDYFSIIHADPNKATNPNPFNVESDVSKNTDLSWTSSLYAASHDVYFGTSFSAVSSAERLDGDADGSGLGDFSDVRIIAQWWLKDPAGSEPYADLDDSGDVDLFDLAIVGNSWKLSSDAVFKGNQNANTFDPPGDLSESTTYYWRIDEVKGPNTWIGDIWEFTVITGSAH